MVKLCTVGFAPLYVVKFSWLADGICNVQAGGGALCMLSAIGTTLGKPTICFVMVSVAVTMTFPL